MDTHTHTHNVCFMRNKGYFCVISAFYPFSYQHLKEEETQK